MPDHAPQAIGIGDESEAVLYVIAAFRSWNETPGAVDWMTDLHDFGR